MRHFPLAALALAAAAFLPGTLSARSHRAEPVRVTRRAVVVRVAHIQHAQPAAFRSAARVAARGRAARPRTPERSSQGGRHRESSQPHGRQQPHRQRFLPVTQARARQVSQPLLLASLSNSRSREDLATPAQPAAVVSVIRPTPDHPQLPSIQQAAIEPLVLPMLFNDHGRLIVPAALVGSHEILVHQNAMADQDGLGRVQDDADLEGMRSKGMLVALPGDGALTVDDRLPYNRRFCRPWTAQFLTALAHAHYVRFHTPLQINSAVRTVAFQVRLQRTNGNAAPAEGDTASPHLTGQAVDIAKRGLSLAEIAWMRGYLLQLIQSGSVDVEEEFQQSCFHISVYRRYLPAGGAAPERIASAARVRSALAVAIR